MDITEIFEVGGSYYKNNLIKKMNTKSWFESRTVWIAIAQGVAGVLTAIYAVDPTLKVTGFGAFIKSVLDLYIRLKTVKQIV